MSSEKAFLELWPSQFVSGAEIKATPEEYADVTIKKIYKKLVKNPEGKESMRVLFDVEEYGRPVLVCKTAGLAIKGLYGADPTEWVGKRIRLIPEFGKWFGKEQYAVRVASQKPPAKGVLKQAAAQLEAQRKGALALIASSPDLEAWYEAAHSGEGISRADLADQVVEDAKRFLLKKGFTAADLLAKLDADAPDPLREPGAAVADREPGAGPEEDGELPY